MQSEAIKILNRILAMSRRKGECVVCYLGLNKYGYSRIHIEDVEYKTHRVIMHLLTGFDLTSTELILHDDGKCKSRACIEFTHLRTGTVSENAADRDKKAGHGVRKGRWNCVHSDSERRVNSEGRSYCLECRKIVHKNYRNRQKQLTSKT